MGVDPWQCHGSYHGICFQTSLRGFGASECQQQTSRCIDFGMDFDSFPVADLIRHPMDVDPLC